VALIGGRRRADESQVTPGQAGSFAAGVLILRALGLGDFLTGVPAYRALRGAFPYARLTLAAPEYLRPLLPLTGAIDRLLPTPGLGSMPSDYPRPDLAVNLHGSGPQSIDQLLALSPQRLITHHHPDRPAVPGPSWDGGLHEVLRWCRLLDLEGIPADPTDLRLSPPSGPPPIGHSIVIHPGAASPARRWPPRRFGTVARSLRSAGQVVITGTANEREVVRAVVSEAGLPPTSDLCGELDLAQLAALVADGRLVISGDTGVAHLATAFGTPSVVLFGPTPPELWGPPPGGVHTALWSGRTGDPHGSTPDPGLLDIGVEAVLEAATERLRSPQPHRSGTNVHAANRRPAPFATGAE
jgi:ADP-heptose:LPS heptosyltransferase